MTSQLVVLTFNTPEAAEEVLRELDQLEEQGALGLEDAVVAVQREGTMVDLKQGRDASLKAASRGGGVGVVAGLLLGGPIVGGLLGLGAGALLGRLRDHGIKDDFVQDVGASLKPGSSALFLLVKQADREQALAVLKRYDARLLSSTLDPEREEALRRSLRDAP